jgi:hypothetical protein
VLDCVMVLTIVCLPAVVARAGAPCAYLVRTSAVKTSINTTEPRVTVCTMNPFGTMLTDIILPLPLDMLVSCKKNLSSIVVREGQYVYPSINAVALPSNTIPVTNAGELDLRHRLIEHLLRIR